MPDRTTNGYLGNFWCDNALHRMHELTHHLRRVHHTGDVVITGHNLLRAHPALLEHDDGILAQLGDVFHDELLHIYWCHDE